MSAYDNTSVSSDLDTFKHSGVQTASVTMSGTIPNAGELNFTTGLIPFTNPDYGRFLYDHSDLYPGKYRDLSMDRVVYVYDTTGSIYDVVAIIILKVSSAGTTIDLRLINPYAANTSIRTTTLNFRYVPFEATI